MGCGWGASAPQGLVCCWPWAVTCLVSQGFFGEASQLPFCTWMARCLYCRVPREGSPGWLLGLSQPLHCLASFTSSGKTLCDRPSSAARVLLCMEP